MMSTQQIVLIVGGTGRTGRRVLKQLLDRGIPVRAIVRSSGKLPSEVVGNPNLTVIEANLLSLDDFELQRHLRGCGAVISCLGHVISLKGVFGPPRDLVTRATTRLCRAIEAMRPTEPVQFILMSSVSVNRPGRLDTRRGSFERAFLAVLCCLVPPAKDNQRATDFLSRTLGADNPFVQWTVVRPDSLREGDITQYTQHEGLVSSLFKADSTNMANVAHFMCELVCEPGPWEDWKGRLPVIVDDLTDTAGAV